MVFQINLLQARHYHEAPQSFTALSQFTLNRSKLQEEKGRFMTFISRQ